MTQEEKKNDDASLHDENMNGNNVEGAELEQDLAAELEEVKGKLQESEEKVLRLAADFENTKKRLERDRDTSLKFAEENILKELLPGIDNIDRALEQAQDSNSIEGLLEGVELTKNGLMATLEKFGVKPIESVGQPFDPNIHEALAMEETAEMDPGLVLREFLKGYFYKDRLLRPAKVIVSKPAGGDS